MRKPAMTRRMICNSAQSRSGWVANRMRAANSKREHGLAQRHTRVHAVDQVGSALRHAPRPHEGQNPRRLQKKTTSFSWPHSPPRNLRKPWARITAFEKGVDLVFDSSFPIGREGRSFFLGAPQSVFISPAGSFS